MILKDLRLIYHDLTYIYISIYLCIYISMGPYGVPGSLSMGPYGVPGSRDSWTRGLGSRGLGTPGLRDPGPRVPGLMDPGPGAQGGLRDPGPGAQGGQCDSRRRGTLGWGGLTVTLTFNPLAKLHPERYRWL